MDVLDFIYQETLADPSKIVLWLVIYFSPLISILRSKKDFSFFKDMTTSHGLVYSVTYITLAFMGFLMARFLMLLASFMSLKFFVDLSSASQFLGVSFISAIDFSIWLVAEKTRFLFAKPLVTRIIFIYWIEMYTVIGPSVLVGYLISLVV